METTIEVGEQSRDLIDILKQFNVAYEMFQTYMEKHYGPHHGYKEDDTRFYDAWCGVTHVVEDILCQVMLWELRDSHFTSI